LVKAFADTWVSLEAYDEDRLAASGTTKKAVALTAEQLSQALASFKSELMKKGEATDLFGMEREKQSIQAIVGNVMQSFGGKPLYQTVEEKAAHLLYFFVKDHPFTDGNKRSGAYAFSGS
ncbi:MAG: Fic family protein, partial [bacterium]|nr:Fic family protein [bacterium]